MTEKTEKQETQHTQPILDARALKVIMNGIDLAFKRGAFNAAEAGPISAAYSQIVELVETTKQQHKNITGDIE